MKYSIDVSSREEGQQLAAGLQDKATRATVRMVGMLAELSPAEQERVLEAIGQRHVDTVRPGAVRYGGPVDEAPEQGTDA